MSVEIEKMTKERRWLKLLLHAQRESTLRFRAPRVRPLRPRKYCSLQSAKSQIIYQLIITTRSSLTNHKQNRIFHLNCPSRAKFWASFGSGTSTSDPYGGAELKRFTFGATVVSPFSVPHGTWIWCGGGALGLNLRDDDFPQGWKMVKIWSKFIHQICPKKMILRHFFFLLHISRWPCFFRFVLFLLWCIHTQNYSNISISIVTLVNSRSHYQKSPQLLIQILKPS